MEAADNQGASACLRGEGVLLRDYVADDERPFMSWAAQEEMYRYMGGVWMARRRPRLSSSGYSTTRLGTECHGAIGIWRC